MPAGSTSTIRRSARWTCARRRARRARPASRPISTSCGGGFCRSDDRADASPASASGRDGGRRSELPIGGAQQAQACRRFPDGVFAQIPMKGILYWNSHAFNLTDEDTIMNGRLNYYFADGAALPGARPIFNASRDLRAPTRRRTRRRRSATTTSCRRARGSSSSPRTPTSAASTSRSSCPTARRSTRASSTTTRSSSASIRRSRSTRPTAAERTLHYCSLYNNGVERRRLARSRDGDARVARAGERAARRSAAARRSPASRARSARRATAATTTRPATRRRAPATAICDACRITGGESTENEMFILIGQYYIDERSAAAGRRRSRRRSRFGRKAARRQRPLAVRGLRGATSARLRDLALRSRRAPPRVEAGRRAVSLRPRVRARHRSPLSELAALAVRACSTSHVGHGAPGA